MADDPNTPDPADATPPDPAADPDPQGDGDPADLGDAGKKALDAERNRAKDAEKKAKELETELEEIKRSQMTDQEKAIEEARAEARAEALAEAGAEIAAAEFKAAAAGRLDDDALGVLLEGLDLKAFLTDGKVDVTKITAFVDGIVPTPERRPADLGQGARGGFGKTADPLLATVQQFVGK